MERILLLSNPGEVIELTFSISEKVIKKNLTSDDNKKIYSLKVWKIWMRKVNPKILSSVLMEIAKEHNFN